MCIRDRIEVAEDVLGRSSVLKEMWEKSDKKSGLTVDYPLNIIKKLFEYCEKIKGGHPEVRVEKPLKTNNFKDLVPEWEYTFTEIEIQDLLGLLSAAQNYQVQGLFELLCVKVATLLKGKAPAEIRDILKITDQLTPEEETEIRNAITLDEQDNSYSSIPGLLIKFYGGSQVIFVAIYILSQS
eukprot:TRINITY_DN1235_c0_g1_i13.p1 TRINITY_DN1235_c0_g1~~TRINITY_DN1235_c0_g1_i13.p1  ORF type:complete len:183 (+),score=41.75 TRINITY_DN1235_c0_g1_i13:116-664(+)